MSSARQPRALKTPAYFKLDAYKQPAPPAGRKGYQMRKMEPDAALALCDAALRQVHPQPTSAEGKQVIFVFNMVCFEGLFDKRLKQLIKGKTRYGNVCRAAFQLQNMTQAHVDCALQGLLQRRVLFVKKDMRLTPYPFLENATLKEGTAARFKEAKRSAADDDDDDDSGGASTVALPRRIKHPDYLKDARYEQPPRPDGKHSWRRSKLMVHDARRAFTDAELRRLHDDIDSADGKQRVIVFNIVAFGKQFVDMPWLQANQVLYGNVCRGAEKYGISKADVDRHLRALLERKVLFVYTDGRGERTLTASHFLETVKLAPVTAPVVLDVYAELTADANAKITTPDFVMRPEYASSPTDVPGEATRWSRACSMGYDVTKSLADESLRRIHPEYDTSDVGRERVALFNVVAFGPFYMEQLGTIQANSISYGQLCRAGMLLNVEHAALDAHLRAMLEARVLSVRHYAPDNSVSIRAFPFLSHTRLVPQTARVENLKRLIRERARRVQFNNRHHVPYSARKRERVMPTAGDRRPRMLVNYHNAYRRHTDLTMQPLPIRAAIDEMLATCTACALCGAAFDRTVHNPSHRHWNPWKPSVNVICPANGSVFQTVEEFQNGTNLVHGVCNLVQHLHDFSEVVDICRFVASRANPNHDGHDSESLRLDDALTSELCQRGFPHGLTREQTRVVISTTVKSVDPFTGMTMGYGSEYDIDLRSHDSLHPLLQLTLDRIDGRVETDGVYNYRIVLRLFNWVTNDFDDKNEVANQWLKNIVQKYAAPVDSNVYNASDDDNNDNCDRDGLMKDDAKEDDVFTSSPSKRQRRYQFVCEWDGCSRVFNSRDRRDWHYRAKHTGERPFTCPHENCAQSFFSKTLLRQHLKSAMHTRLRFCCQLATCDGVFSTAVERDAHVRGHYTE